MTYDFIIKIIYVPLNSSPQFNGASDNGNLQNKTAKCHFSQDSQAYLF